MRGLEVPRTGRELQVGMGDVHCGGEETDKSRDTAWSHPSWLSVLPNLPSAEINVLSRD